MKRRHASLVVMLLGCGPGVHSGGSNAGPAGTFLITAEQIQRSGARTAWEALKQNAPMLTLRDDRNQKPPHRGPFRCRGIRRLTQG